MIGKQILNYKIESLIGEGGMGNVYLATHEKLGRKVAVKSILPQFAKNEEIKSRFENEARTMSKLHHPNIVSLYDYYSGEEGLFLFMEFVEGKELQDYLDDLGKPIDEDLSVAFMRQILSAFSHAHNKGIVHRDIKPSNIIISNNGEIKILDFGIAKLLDESGHNLTKTGTQIGTVYYMSPEQVEGKKVSHLSDIYSIGVTMYQMLTMHNPYKTCTTEFEIYKKITSEKLPDASEINQSLSTSIVDIIHKATAKDPKNRFQSCHEFDQAFNGDFSVQSDGVIQESNKDNIPISDSNKSDVLINNSVRINVPGANSALVLGILGFVFIWFPVVGFILSLIAIIQGAQANKKYRLNPEKYRVQSKSTGNAGRIMGIIGIIFSILYWVIIIVTIIIAAANDSSYDYIDDFDGDGIPDWEDNDIDGDGKDNWDDSDDYNYDPFY